MAILKKSNKQRYTVISNDLLRDDNLSLKDIGLLVKLLSLPDNWEFSEVGLQAILKKDGQTSIRTAIKNLEKYGYLKRIRIRGEKGQISNVEWHIFEDPQNCQNPHFENHSLDYRLQINTNIQNTKKSKESKEATKKFENQTYNDIIDGYTTDDNLREALRGFLRLRAMQKRPMTNQSLALMLQKLSSLSDSVIDQTQIIYNAIRNSTTDIYPLSTPKSHAPNPDRPTSYNLDDYQQWSLDMMMGGNDN